MAEIKSESVADFIPESLADLLRNQHFNFQVLVVSPCLGKFYGVRQTEGVAILSDRMRVGQAGRKAAVGLALRS